ncbi:MAG: bifunctional folylpolyglutamate synthase/dihydrofolate synthase [Campylobacterota bacterium]|nr:bifunctional folylpolyglutamate synthase/dihydrofolate synthase [Campylobacterota bacterium]
MPSFLSYLDAKPLYYKEIDHQRVHQAYALLKPHITHPKTIHLIGTNGKGSTGRTLAHLISKSGLSVMHYSSPHILRFNERIWINGKDSSDETLEVAHQQLFSILGQKISDELSYFEYTTLLALVVGEACAWIVFEAGLGGEFDATNVVSKTLSIITPIGLDHQAFLGDTIEAIATTKINSVDNDALLAIGNTDEVKQIAQKICRQKNATLHYTHNQYQSTIQSFGFSGYLADNIATAVTALDILGVSYNLDDLQSLELFGRFYKLAPNITIDVGHNPLSARQIAKNLGDKKVVLIYNTLEDKEYQEILTILKNNIQSVEIIDINTPRALKQEDLENYLDSIGIEYQKFQKIEKHKEYLVYGSFYTVESFLKYYENR